MGNIRKHILVSGKVQGVFFRSNVLERAKILGLRGWVRNLEDGRVEIVAEGNEEEINKLIKWCYHGPENAEVDKIEITSEPYLGKFEEFKRLN